MAQTAETIADIGARGRRWVLLHADDTHDRLAWALRGFSLDAGESIAGHDRFD